MCIIKKCNAWFSNKNILAWILNVTVDEVRNQRLEWMMESE